MERLREQMHAMQEVTPRGPPTQRGGMHEAPGSDADRVPGPSGEARALPRTGAAPGVQRSVPRLGGDGLQLSADGMQLSADQPRQGADEPRLGD